MNPVRSNDATSVVFELLEPRLLLSTSVTPGLEAPGFGVPAYVDVVLPDHKLDTDTVSACLREAHADLEAGEDGVIDLVGSLQVAGVRVNDAGELQVYVHVNAVGNLGTQYRFLFGVYSGDTLPISRGLSWVGQRGWARGVERVATTRARRTLPTTHLPRQWTVNGKSVMCPPNYPPMDRQWKIGNVSPELPCASYFGA
jgi:hypothetical protein